MSNYGVIDLGSNTIRLVVYETRDDRRKACGCKEFKSLINDKVMAGLSAYVENGVFSQAGIDRGRERAQRPRETRAILRLQETGGVRHGRAGATPPIARRPWRR